MGSGPYKPQEASAIAPAGDELPYKTAAALHAAIKTRLLRAAKQGPHDVDELRRQFAYDRLLVRVFNHSPDKWVLTGGAGLLARIPEHARHTMDLDLYYQGETAAAVTALTEAGEQDLGDHFSFAVGRVTTLAGANPGAQVAMTAYIGAVMFTGFRVDTTVSTNMTGQPESTPAITPITIPGLPTTNYRAYPLADHIADKHAAMVATYSDGQPSTRYRDLVDLAIIATTQYPQAADIHTALMSEYSHRGITPPQEVTLPADSWISGYQQAAAAVPNFAHTTAADGLAVVKAFLDPILAGRTNGKWNPTALIWSD